MVLLLFLSLGRVGPRGLPSGLGFDVSGMARLWRLSPSPGVTLSVLVGARDVGLLQPVVAQFEASHPNIHLELVEGPSASNLVEDLYSSAFLLGRSPYDLIYLDTVWVPKFAEAGWLLDLSDRLPPENQEQFWPRDLAGSRYGDRLYRIPSRTDAGLLYYRKDLLAQADMPPPETFEALLEAAQKVQQLGKVDWGFVWQGKQYEGLVALFLEILTGKGGFWLGASPEMAQSQIAQSQIAHSQIAQSQQVGLDRPEAIAAVQFLREAIATQVTPAGVTTYAEEEARRLFQSGQAVFLRNWVYTWPLANALDSPIRAKIAVQPMVHGAGHPSGACLGGWGWGISSDSRYPEAAWQAVEFLTSEAAQKQIALQSGHLPTRRSLYHDREIVEKYPYFSTLPAVLDQGVVRPRVAQYDQVSDILQRYLSAAIADRLSPEAAMTQAARETRQLLGLS